MVNLRLCRPLARLPAGMIEFPIIGDHAAIHMTGYRRYRASRFFVWPALLCYVAIALAAKPSNAIEFFPFFNWDLFALNSDRRGDVTLRVASIDGHPLPEPRLFYEMKETFSAARAKDSRLMKLLDRWAVALRAGDAASAARFRAIVEYTFMPEVTTAAYDLVIVHYRPIQRLRGGDLDSVDILGSFNKVGR